MTSAPVEEGLYTFLSDETKRDRRSLLIASVAAVAVGGAGIVPTQIGALGIAFSEEDRASLLWVIAGIVGYLLLGFLLHSVLDLLRWIAAYRRDTETLEAKLRAGDGDMQAVQQQLERLEKLKSWSVGLFLFAVYEFGIPLALGVFALIVVLGHAGV
ncbi:MAG TPA: hypothetical protein VFX98_08480 [Longimicrobiaceae bacterium]|nr:hypothetical protein [Longimicrobiaceae bacterium]